MLPLGLSKRGINPQQKLLHLFHKLTPEQQSTLLEFAEFLAARAPERMHQRPIPAPHPRPEKESVVKAIKRLSATYPMVDKAKMLDETSALVAQHIMQGRSAREVIDELEQIFEKHFRKLLDQFEYEEKD